MDERVIQFRVGVLVLATCIITGILIILFGEVPSFLRQQYTIFVRFDQAPGVTINTPVRKSGILIGRVTNVELNDRFGVLVSLRIDGDRPLKKNELCRISTGALLGDAVLEFVPSREPGAPIELVSEGDYMNGIVAADPLGVLDVLVNLEDDITYALSSMTNAGNEVSLVARNLNVLVENNNEQFRRILQKSEQAMDRFDLAMSAVNEFAADDEMRTNLKRSLEDVPKLLDDAGEMLDALKSMAERADRNLQNLEGLTGPLGERGDDLVNSIGQSVDRIDELLSQFVQFGQAINNSDGTLGQLLNNPDLYQRLNQAAWNIEQLTRRLRPVVENARVFTDKVARDPGRIGVKGALDRRQSGIKR